MSKATEDNLGELHAMVAETYKAEIQRYKDNNEPVPVALLSSLVKFLKDNNIEADPTKSTPLQDLSSFLPFNPKFPTDTIKGH